MGSLWSYQIKCSLVSTASVKPLLHTYKDYAIKFFFVEELNGILLNCHMYQFPILGNKGKNPNSKEKVFTYQRLMCEEFLICKTYWGKI